MKLLLRILLSVASLALFFALAELVYRWLGPEEVDASNLHQRYRVFYMNPEREEITLAEGIEQGLIVSVDPSPRPRWTWAPETMFYLCYSGVERSYLDEHGCVPCRFNSRMIRDREELCAPKPPGQRRILCVGDSFTLGWGVPVEQAWPRLCEAELRRTDDGVRTVNCGASGAIYADEYRVGLEQRYHLFEPDAVVVGLCLNDLLPTSTALSQQRPLPWLMDYSRLLRDLLQSYAMQASLTFDPERDVVQELLDLPEELYPPWASKAVHRVGRAALWAGGGPQRALIGMRDWCRERRLPFGVVIWPYFQGLGPGEHYPFEKIHRLVASFCSSEGIPCLDLLPTFRGRETPSLWVSPADYHGNPEAQRLAAVPITEFLRELCDL